MLHRVVVGLDGSEYADSATRFACRCAQRTKATLVGVAVVDTPGIEASSRGAGIGAYEYAKRVREHRVTDACEHAQRSLERFRATCEEHRIPCDLAYRDAVPFQAIIDVARYADLIIVGLRTYFHHETQEHSDNTLSQLMNVCACPVLAVPRQADLPAEAAALIACDGSIQSARAMRAFVHMAASGGKGESLVKSITLLHVGEGTEEDQHVQLDEAKKYAESFGFAVQIIRRTMEGSRGASGVIEDVAGEIGAALIVMGAYGRRGIIHKLFFGSTASSIIRNERLPVYIYH